MRHVGASFWAWDAATWAGVLGISGKAFLTTYPRWARTSARSYAIALAYLFGFIELHLLPGDVGRGAVARKVFGQAAVDQAVERLPSVLHGWGQRSPQVTARTASLVCHALLLNRSPLLADLFRGRVRACGRPCRSQTRSARTCTACTGRWRRSGMSARHDRRRD